VQNVIAHPDGIYAIDSGYGRPQLAAIHLIVHEGRVAVVDTGNNASVPRVLAVLAGLGIPPQAVDWVMLTHVHLDHAGGAGSLMCALPNARLVVHPRGARHMADPQRLWEGTAAVYGAERAFSLYGRLVPVPAERIEAVAGARLLAPVQANELFVGMAPAALTALEEAGFLFYRRGPGTARFVCRWDTREEEVAALGAAIAKQAR